MQYQFAGTDPMGRLIYQPVSTTQNVQVDYIQAAPAQEAPVVHHQCSCAGCGA